MSAATQTPSDRHVTPHGQRELDGVLGRLVDVRVSHHHHRVLAAALEHDALQLGRGLGQDLGASGGRTGEGAHVDSRV